MSSGITPKILVVDDQEESLGAIAATLRSAGAEVLQARSGMKALELLVAHEVALALVDVRMPEMDGFALAEKMRGAPRTREIPIIFITGYQEPGRAFRGYESGAVDFLFKPVEPFVLRSKVAVFLQLYRQKEQLAERVTQLEAALRATQRAQVAQREAEARLRESEERAVQQLAELETLYESAPIGLCVFDENLRWVRVNERIAEINGRPIEEHLGKTPSELVPDIGAQAEEALQTVLRTGNRFDFEMHGTTAAQPGIHRTWSEHWVPIKNATGRIVGISVAAEEITERKRTEKALREADQRKNEFLAVLSHELRNPLAPILNSIYVLERATPGGEQSNRARQVIERQTQHMTRLIEDLLDVTRISRGKITLHCERVELNALARGAAEDHREAFSNSGVELIVEDAAQPLYVDGDPTRLAQVIGNILSNSAKFTKGGRAILSVALAGENQAVLRVRDSGIGMSPSMLEHLFEPFVQADRTLDRTRGGLGLGLALVKGLVELHGGTVKASSDGPGMGSEFTVTLPAHTSAKLRLAALPPARPRGRRRRVLVIEDNLDAAESLREVLELEDHEVATAYSGPEGLEKARSFQPDVVLCDIGLPGMDGYGVARVIRADPALRSTYLVALTGYALQDDVQRAKDVGFDRHMAKPPDLEALTRLLDEVPLQAVAG